MAHFNHGPTLAPIIMYLIGFPNLFPFHPSKILPLWDNESLRVFFLFMHHPPSFIILQSEFLYFDLVIFFLGLLLLLIVLPFTTVLSGSMGFLISVFYGRCGVAKNSFTRWC